MIIGFCGPKRSGKNYVAEVLLDEVENGYATCNSETLYDRGVWELGSFADPLRSFVLDIFDMGHSHAEGYLKEVPVRSLMPSHEHVKAACKYYFGNQKPARLISSYLTSNQGKSGFIDKSYRELMVYIGTELVRKGVDEDYWVKVLDKRCKKGNYIVTDVRMENEAKYVRENGIIVHIENPDVHYTGEHLTEIGVTMQDGDLIFRNDLKSSSREFGNNILNLKKKLEEKLL